MKILSYFYIIKHTRTGLYYAGCRYAKGCSPDELLVNGGYFTSSSIVKRIINDEGVLSFSVDRVRLFDTRDGAFTYESRFLKKVKASSNPMFLNASENSPFIENTQLANILRAKTCNFLYGVNNVSQNKDIRNKQENTVFDRYGVKNVSHSEHIKSTKLQTRLLNNGGKYASDEQIEKTRLTCLEKYGEDHPVKTEDVKEKIKSTCLEKYGVPSYLSTPRARFRLKEVSLELYGVENPSQSDQVKEKIKNTTMQNLGVEWAMQSEQTKVKSIETCLLRYGVTHPSKTKDFQDSKRKSNLEKYGVDHINKLPERKEIKAQRDSLKRSRKVVADIKKLQAFLHISIGKGWDLKSDSNLLTIFNSLLLLFYNTAMVDSMRGK